MSFYTRRINEHFLAPRNVGDAANPTTSAEAASFTCGAVVRIQLEIDPGTQEISEAKFRAAGCGYLIAAASLLTEIIRGLKTSEAAAATQLFPETLNEYFGVPPSGKKHCGALCAQALLEAVTRYSQNVRAEWTGEEALICTCFGVSERRIEEAIRERGLRNVSEVTRACNAGGGCHSCHPLIEEMLEVHWRTENSSFIFETEEP